MQKRNLFVYCVKTATFPLVACYTLARLFNLNTQLKDIYLRHKNKRTKELFCCEVSMSRSFTCDKELSGYVPR